MMIANTLDSAVFIDLEGKEWINDSSSDKCIREVEQTEEDDNEPGCFEEDTRLRFRVYRE